MLHTGLHVHGAIGPFSGELIVGDHISATERLRNMAPLDAVRLVLMAAYHSETVIMDSELIALADHLGVFAEEVVE